MGAGICWAQGHAAVGAAMTTSIPHAAPATDALSTASSTQGKLEENLEPMLLFGDAKGAVLFVPLIPSLIAPSDSHTAPGENLNALRGSTFAMHPTTECLPHSVGAAVGQLYPIRHLQA